MRPPPMKNQMVHPLVKTRDPFHKLLKYVLFNGDVHYASKLISNK
jgi:hypothetical protein